MKYRVESVTFTVNPHLSSPKHGLLFSPSPHTLPGLLDMHPTTCRVGGRVAAGLQIIRNYCLPAGRKEVKGSQLSLETI